ncbi:MAG: class I SAM-dependent methyltransferase, partial [Planktomarina sp.]
AGDIAAISPVPSPLRDIYAANSGTIVHKWHHYIPLYERYFSQFRGTDFKFLEIGVFKGGSLDMWRSYFGDAATITGIDIDPTCARFDGKSANVRIGSQDDPAFLAQTVDEMGGIDLVLDDGSHHMGHIRTSLATLFPLLADGGVYMIEDLHTCYWPQFGGDLRGRGTVYDDIRRLIDDMHTPYTLDGTQPISFGDQIAGIHVHDSVVVLEKKTPRPPVHSKVGGV